MKLPVLERSVGCQRLLSGPLREDDGHTVIQLMVKSKSCDSESGVNEMWTLSDHYMSKLEMWSPNGPLGDALLSLSVS